MTALATATFVLLAMIGAITARDIPEFLHICSIRDPQYSNCIFNSLEILKPHLKSGVPEFNIPPIEPLKLGKLMFTPTSSLQAQADDITVTGSSNFILSKVRADFKQMRYLINIELPNILVEGKYDVNGRILLLPIHGSGPFHGNFSDCKGVVKVQAEKYFDHNVEKLRMTEFKLKFSVGKGVLHLENLFGGEKVLGDVINQVINSNFDAFVKEFSPVVEKALSAKLQDNAQKILEQFSYEQLFSNDS